jgi:hypothetical protein
MTRDCCWVVQVGSAWNKSEAFARTEQEIMIEVLAGQEHMNGDWLIPFNVWYSYRFSYEYNFDMLVHSFPDIWTCYICEGCVACLDDMTPTFW